MREMDVPHRLCHFQHLHHAAKPIFGGRPPRHDRSLLGAMPPHGERVGSLGGALAQFRKVTRGCSTVKG
jgi:hypothetical protein